MMAHILSFSMLLLIFSSSPVHADSLAEATKILEFYKTENYLESGLPCMEKNLTAHAKDLKITPANQKRMQSLIKRIYPASNLYKIFKESFAKNYSPDKVAWKAKFINTVQGIKLRQAYSGAFSAGAPARQSFYDQNSAKLLTVNRKNAVVTFVTASEQDRLYSLLQAKCYLGISLTQNGTLGEKQKSSIRQLKDAAELREPGYMEEARKIYQIFDFFLLKDHNMSEVDDLSTFYSSPNGQAFTKAYKKSLASTMEAAANTLNSQMMQPAKKN